MNSSVSDFFHVIALGLQVEEFYVRTPLLFLILAPAFFIVVAVLGGQWLVGWLALVALFAGAIVIANNATIVAAAGTIELARKVMRVLLSVIVGDICLALYLALVPVSTNPKLVPIVVLSAVVVVLTASSDQSGMGCLRGILICCIVAVTFAFFFSSKDVSNLVQQMNDQSKRNTPSSAPTNQSSQSYPDCPDSKSVELTPSTPTAQLKLHPNCLSGQIAIRWTYGLHYAYNVHYAGKFMETHFWDGRTIMSGDDGSGIKRADNTWLGDDNRNSIFRLRGEEGSVATITVKTQ